MDLKDAVTARAEQIAADRFDDYGPGIEEWVREAIIGEWGALPQKAAQHYLRAAQQLANRMYDLDRSAAFNRAYDALRGQYMDYAIVQGTYDGEAYWDAVDAAADAADNARAARDEEAAQAAMRG